MKRFLLFALLGLVGMAIIIGFIGSVSKAKTRRALNDYKAKLKAQGEKLTWEEWGYPRAPETNDCLPRLVQAAGLLGNRSLSPGNIKLMDLSSVTDIQACWTRADLLLHDKSQPKLSWQKFAAEMEAASVALSQVRRALSNPPSYVMNNPTNLAVRPQFHLVEQRNVAQWLSAEIIFTLRERELDRAQENLWALQQLVHLHEDDRTLVSQMIRVAITGLALRNTWEALQSPGWSEHHLAELQRGWERINLFTSLEKGLESERLFLDTIFSQVRALEDSVAELNLLNSTGGGANTGGKGFDYYWQVMVVLPIQRSNRDADELLALRHEQNCLDSVRRLNQGNPWPTVERELRGYHEKLNQSLDGPMARVRYDLSSRMIPNTQKAALTAVRNETLRRLAVSAIAIKRYELNSHQLPLTLAVLVPDYLSAVPMDPMNGKPLSYRRNAESGFVLYSVGDDGIDDGGQASPVTPSEDNEIWDWKDWVWPTVTATNHW